MTMLPYSLDPVSQVRVGLVVLQADETIEAEMSALLGARADLLVSRVPSGLEVSRETLAEMEAHLPASAGLFPHGMKFSAIGYGCTSGASVIGSHRVAQLIRTNADTQAVSDPVQGLIAACRALGITRLAIISPYVEEVSNGLRTVLRDDGVDSPVFASFEVAEEAKVARISGQSLVDAACAIGGDRQTDAVFLSCTNLRTIGLISEIEDKLQKPVLSSTQVLAWHMAQLAGLPALAPMYGKLMLAY